MTKNNKNTTETNIKLNERFYGKRSDGLTENLQNTEAEVANHKIDDALREGNHSSGLTTASYMNNNTPAIDIAEED